MDSTSQTTSPSYPPPSYDEVMGHNNSGAPTLPAADDTAGSGVGKSIWGKVSNADKDNNGVTTPQRRDSDTLQEPSLLPSYRELNNLSARRCQRESGSQSTKWYSSVDQAKKNAEDFNSSLQPASKSEDNPTSGKSISDSNIESQETPSGKQVRLHSCTPEFVFDKYCKPEAPLYMYQRRDWLIRQ